MNTFVRQLTALAALWALCELLVPLERHPMVRLAVHLMVLAALVVSVGQLLNQAQETEWPVFAASEVSVPADGYRRIALTGYANQMEQACLRVAQNAGYEAQAAVYLRLDGAVERVEMRLFPCTDAPLITEDRLAEGVARLLKIPVERVVWQSLGREATP